MIDYEKMRVTVVKGLRTYLDCPVIRSNQTAELPPYPYISYTVTTLMSANRGTYGEWDDGIARKQVTTTWSITALSDDNAESVALAMKAREWLELVGQTYLNDNKVIVQSVGAITNRDNILTYGYEYRNGFDCVFWCHDEVKMPETEEIKEVVLGDDINDRLEARLDGVERYAVTGNQKQTSESDALNDELGKRLNGA
jgi:hypothetical protein